jgi:UDP-N-acetylglucosamine diphosphorylase/glucosamine-1-phosphate N-acetyltransferase
MHHFDRILIYEPQNASQQLYPFSLMHPSWEIRCGAFRLWEKIEKLFSQSAIPITFHGRNLIARSFAERYQEVDLPSSLPDSTSSCLILHGSALWNYAQAAILKEAITEITVDNPQTAIQFFAQSTPVATYVPEGYIVDTSSVSTIEKFIHSLDDNAKSLQIDVPIISFLWDAIAHNATAIEDDVILLKSSFSKLSTGTSQLYFHEGVHGTYIGENVTIGAGSVLDSSEGTIILGNNVRIMPQSTILGPCFIGHNSIIKVASKIYGETSIGEHCKVGGEVENSIFQSYSNKQHDGFVGHSFISEWVNLGADTNTSDLKNNYGNIRVQFPHQTINTNRMMLGCLCGDHTKTSINTMLNTGTTCGVFANIFTNGFPDKFIPSFSWGGHKEASHFRLDDALDLAARVMQRRNRFLTESEKELIFALHPEE